MFIESHFLRYPTCLIFAQVVLVVEKVIFTVILDLKSQFFGHYEPLIGSLGFEKVSY